MGLGWLILVIAAVWFAVEFGIRDRTARVVLQCLMVLGTGFMLFGAGTSIGRFSPTLEGNNQLKNLTQGLVVILEQEGLDDSLLLEQMKSLDKSVVPTYESYAASRQAVKDFLKFYNIDYADEIKIDSTESH